MPRALVVLIALVVTCVWLANSVSALLGGPTVPEVNGIFTTLITAGGIFGGGTAAMAAVQAWRRGSDDSPSPSPSSSPSRPPPPETPEESTGSHRRRET